MNNEEDEVTALLKEKYKDRKICVAWPSPEKTDYRFNHDMLQFATRNSHYIRTGVANRVSSRIAVNRNLLVQDARAQHATDIMWVDADTKFPINGLVRLLAYDKDIVCSTTARRQGNDMRPIGEPISKEADYPGQNLWPMKFVGMPFMLTKLSVFDRLDELFIEMSGGKLTKGKIPYFAEPPRWMVPEIDTNNDEIVGEDEYFCHFARKAGLDIWCDEELSFEIGHIGSTVYYISPGEPPAPAKVDLILGETAA